MEILNTVNSVAPFATAIGIISLPVVLVIRKFVNMIQNTR